MRLMKTQFCWIKIRNCRRGNELDQIMKKGPNFNHRLCNEFLFIRQGFMRWHNRIFRNRRREW
jgi:hypothetical protein